MENENVVVTNENAQVTEATAAPVTEAPTAPVTQMPEPFVTQMPVSPVPPVEPVTEEIPSAPGKKAGTKKEELHLTPEQKMMEKLLKKQLFHARVHTALIAIFVAIVAAAAFYGYGFMEGIKTTVKAAEATMSSVDETLGEAQTVMEQVSKKLDDLDMEKINGAVDKTDELIGIMEDTMTQTNEVIQKMSSYTTTLDSVQKKVDSIDGFLSKLKIF